MFLHCVDPEPEGSRLGFELSLAGVHQKVRGTGEVAWSRETYGGPGRPPGMAVRFLTLDPKGARQLTEVLGAPPRADVALRETQGPDAAGEGALGSWRGEGELEVYAGDLVVESRAEREAVGNLGAPVTAGVAPDPGLPAAVGGAGLDAVATEILAAAVTAGGATPEPSRPLRRLLVGGGVAVVVGLVGAAAWWYLGSGGEPREGPARFPAATDPRVVGPPVPATLAVPPTVAPPFPVLESPPAETSLPAEVQAATRLVDVRWESLPEGTRVVLALDGAVDAARLTSSRIAGEVPRQVLELAGVQAARPGEARWEVGSAEVRAVRTGFHPGATGGALHVVLDLGASGVELARLEVVGDELWCELVSR